MTTINQRSEHAVATLPRETDKADLEGTLSAARVRIARLEKTVAELLLKNEQLRQQVQ